MQKLLSSRKASPEASLTLKKQNKIRSKIRRGAALDGELSALSLFEEKILEIKGANDKKIAEVLREHGIVLTPEEIKKVVRLLGRNPTLTEATIWGIQGSEHSSYKSSRRHLKKLPTDGPNVILGPSQDAGIVEIAREPGKKGKRFGIVVSHESHNHPSQVVPYEGAATGVGGCVRDVLCMGAKVIAVADGLRFGDIKRAESKLIASSVIDGIGGYGNPIGVPNLAGDVYFNSSFNDNCLVNVTTLGLLREDEIIHSRAPKGAGERGYEIIIVGKATDLSGMGGASFASLKLRESDREKNKGAVQEPNPFLKRHIMQSTYDLFRLLKEKGLLEKVGFKDLGAGGIMCATVEMVASSGYGAEIDLKKVHTSIENLPPHVIACAETQERMCWMVPKELTKVVLKHYNETWALPEIARGATASVIGKVTKGKYVLWYEGRRVCDANASDITEGLSYNRPVKEKRNREREPDLPLPRDLNQVLLNMLEHEDIACRMPIYESYDKNVQGLCVLEAGDADAGVMEVFRNRGDVPEEIKKVGVALKLDANPRYGLIDPYWQAANAVAEGCRNVAAVGATPIAITDCLNYGNPEKPEHMYAFVRGVEGISDALRGIGLRQKELEKTAEKEVKKGAKILPSPLPCISGNVSFYNESDKGAIAPQALIATIGKLADASAAVSIRLKEPGNLLFLIGPRKNELGGSVYYDMMGHLGAALPQPNFAQTRREIDVVTDLIATGYVRSCHDISDGGLAVALAEMCIGGRSDGTVGAKVNITNIALRKAGKDKKTLELRTDKKLFAETGGFVLEIPRRNARAAQRLASRRGAALIKLGFTTQKKNLVVFDSGKEVISTTVAALRSRWTEGLREKLNS